MKCVLIFGVIALVLVQLALAEDECVDGTSQKSDDNCNDCYCTQGVWACTRKQCDGPKVVIRDKRDVPACKSGQTKLDDEDCNTCHCHDGRWACTEKLCPPKPKN